MKMRERKLLGLAMTGVVCFFLCVVSFASAQSPATHPKRYNSTHYTHYRSTRLPGVDQKPRSVASSVAPETGKSSGKAAMSPNKELDQLERASVMKPSAKSAASRTPVKSALVPEKHSAPINFTHKELPPSPHSGPTKIH